MHPNSPTPNAFTLVLSGGGALGYAHLGVLADLEVYGYHPSEVIGTSFGGIVAACIAIGMREEQIYTHFQSFGKISKWIKLSFSSKGFIHTKKLERIFHRLFGETRMSETKIPLKLIATNLQIGMIKVFDQTDHYTITDCLLATIAIPGIFHPKHIETIPYGDGYLCENLGVAYASYDDIIAVNVLGKNALDPHTFNHKKPSLFDTLDRSVRILIFNQTLKSIQQSQQNISLIEPHTHAYKSYHFNKLDAIRKEGIGLLQECLHKK